METEMKVSQSETVTKTTTIGIDEKCVVNGNGSPPMGAAFRHHLPQIASLMRNPKIAQSKTSKTEKDEATLHVEGTGKVVRLDADLKHEITIEEIPKPEPKENADGDAKQEKTENSKKTPTPRTRPPKKARREELPTNGTGDAPVEEEKMDTTNSNEEVDKLNITTVVKNPESKENKEKIVEEVKMESTNKIETPLKEESNEIDIQQKTPRRRSKESYKNIFQEPIIEGKRQRKPKVLDSEEPDSPKTSPKTAAKIEEEEKLKAKMEHIAALEERKPIDWLLGDLLWGKVSSHPWWPCMVSYDPYDGIYTKIKGKSRMYHVQYFGDEAERGWVATSAILEFQGKQKYDEHVKKCYDIAKHKKEKSKVDKLFKIYPNRMAAWKIAIKAAEEALPLSRNERRQKYTFVYEIKKPKKAAEVPTSSPSEKVEESESTETSSNSTKKRARHSVDGKAQKNSGDVCNGLIEEKKRKRATDSKESDNQTPKSKRQKTATPSESDSISHQRTVSSEGSFEVFCQKHRDSVLDDHPDFDEGMLQECLKQQWCMMSVKQKCRYKSKFATDSNTDSGKAKRVSKPSKKKLEAEEDNKLLEDLDKPGNQHKSVDSKDTQRDTEVPMATEDSSSVEVKSVSARRSSVQKSEVVQEKPAGKISKQRKSTTTDTDSNSDSQKSEVVQEKPAGKISKQRKSTTTDTDSNSDSQKSEVVQEKPAAKISKQRKSTTADTDSNSDSQDFVKSEKRVVQKCSIDDYEPEIFRLSAAGPNKKENLCQICEEVGELVECHGPCQGYFHKNCLGLKKDPSDDFKCDECQTGNHTCFVCKKADSCTKRCSVATCGKFYHEECISKIPNTRMETRGIICPLHICATCAAENAKNPKAKQGKLMRCVRCPVAYHTGDFCLAAGCVSLAGYNIVCTKHFQPIRTQKYHTHINVSWCFVCNRGGSLLCCESCPAAYHAECLKIDFPEESWYCADCSNGRKPLYGDIIWVKIGSYRWWPGEIYHPKNVPQNIQDKPHQVGEFPVRFFGSHDYFWLHQGRVFLFQEGDKGSKDSAASKGLAKIFSRGIKEATEVYKLWKAAKENKEQIENEKNDKKPAPFKFVKTNVPVGSVQIYKADLTEVPKCECKADQPNPCSSETDCINRMLMYECHPTVCPAGEKCQNQRFQKREYPDSVPNKTDKRGWGLITKVDIKKGQFVNEYVGELIDEEEVKRRIKQAHDDNICNFYMLTLDKNRIIDAGPKGNLSRFMNHSCNPNCETQKWTVNGDVRVGLFALHDIPKGSELTFNYNLECLGNDKKACSCGATNCSGYLGVRPRSAAAVAKEERGKDKPKKKRKRKIKLDVKKEHEDECFRCGEGGELVMCDKAGCPKVYHLQCLKLTKPPHGKWQCPWHHCDTCGNTAVKMCTECPNSFCATHIEGNTFDVDGLVYCCDHDDVLEEATTSSTSSHVSDSQSELEDKPEKPPETKKTKNKKRESAQDRKRSVNSSDKEETGVKKPRQSTGRKSSSDTDGKDGKTTKFTNVVVTPTKNSADDPLAVPPMFDDSDEDEFSDLVIDIPTIL